MFSSKKWPNREKLSDFWNIQYHLLLPLRCLAMVNIFYCLKPGHKLNFHFTQIVEDIFAQDIRCPLDREDFALKRLYLQFRAFVSFSLIMNPSYFVAEVKCIMSDLEEQTYQRIVYCRKRLLPLQALT